MSTIAGTLEWCSPILTLCHYDKKELNSNGMQHVNVDAGEFVWDNIWSFSRDITDDRMRSTWKIMHGHTTRSAC